MSEERGDPARPAAYSGIPASRVSDRWVPPRWLKISFLCLAALAVALILGAKLWQHYGEALDEAALALDAEAFDRPAPALRLLARDGSPVDLASLRGKVVLVNFWASWCPPCRQEAPGLRALARRMDPRTFALVAVSEDQGWPAVEKFMGAPPAEERVVLDPDGAVEHAWGTFKLPETYFIDRRGHIRFKLLGARDFGSPEVAALLHGLGARERGPPAAD